MVSKNTCIKIDCEDHLRMNANLYHKIKAKRLLMPENFRYSERKAICALGQHTWLTFLNVESKSVHIVHQVLGDYDVYTMSAETLRI